MCGIIGYVGNKNAIPILIEGLKKLEYRGYDSAGIAYIKNQKIITKKKKGKIKNLETSLEDDNSNIGIGHTRWATHGKVNVTNCHPHTVGDITLVHNGIIENYEKLKNELLNKGYNFKSDTDSEVAAAYIDYLYKQDKDILKVLNSCKNYFKGSYALGIILHDKDDSLYALRKDSPLIIGISKDGNFIASDMPAILKYTNSYLLLDNDEVAVLTKNNVLVYNNLKPITKKTLTFDYNEEESLKDEYEHYM